MPGAARSAATLPVAHVRMPCSWREHSTVARIEGHHDGSANLPVAGEAFAPGRKCKLTLGQLHPHVIAVIDAVGNDHGKRVVPCRVRSKPHALRTQGESRLLSLGEFGSSVH